MKPFRIFLFIIVTLLLLVVVSFCIPNGEIHIGSVTLKFPTPEQVMKMDQSSDTIEIESPWEGAEGQIREHINKEQMSAREQMEYELKSNPTMITVPNDSVDYFNAFFLALEQAKLHPIRILHLGDSQIEEDRISGVLREHFQSVYGGNGPGMIPAIQTVQTTSLRQSCSTDMRRYMIYGPAQMRHKERLYGVMGQMAHLNGKAVWHFDSPNMKRTQPGTKHYSQVTFMVGQPSGDVLFYGERNNHFTDTLTIDSTNQNIQFITLRLEGQGAKATVTAMGDVNLYGLLLDGSNGVSLDNIPLRGSAGTVFTSIATHTLAPYFNHYQVPLIILQFGGNTVPYLRGEKSIAHYCEGMARQIQHLKKLSPRSTFLFIGPSDMCTNVDGQMQTYPELPRIVASLKQCCLNNGIAYFDLYSAMGGYGSMARWAHSNPPLAGLDYVHFTPRGADKSAEILYESLMQFHNYYLDKDSL